MNNTPFENEAVLAAYQNLAQTLLDFVGKNSWDEAVAKYEIFSNMVSSEFCWKKMRNVLSKEYLTLGMRFGINPMIVFDF